MLADICIYFEHHSYILVEPSGRYFELLVKNFAILLMVRIAFSEKKIPMQ